jgi:thioredoxin-like negative regulator of GroEL
VQTGEELSGPTALERAIGEDLGIGSTPRRLAREIAGRMETLPETPEAVGLGRAAAEAGQVRRATDELRSQAERRRFQQQQELQAVQERYGETPPTVPEAMWRYAEQPTHLDLAREFERARGMKPVAGRWVFRGTAA